MRIQNGKEMKFIQVCLDLFEGHGSGCSSNDTYDRDLSFEVFHSFEMMLQSIIGKYTKIREVQVVQHFRALGLSLPNSPRFFTILRVRGIISRGKQLILEKK